MTAFHQKRRDKAMESLVTKAKSPVIKGSVQKINLCLKAIRGKQLFAAMDLLDRMQKAAAPEIKKLLNSALSNAENSGFYDVDRLVVKNISAGKALMLKRFHPRARGRIFRVNKHYSRVYLELHEKVEAA